MISGTSTFTTTLGVDMNLDGTASSSVKTVDNSSGEQIITSTTVDLPKGYGLKHEQGCLTQYFKGCWTAVPELAVKFLTTNISALTEQ